jgi:hypothetical protein
MTESKTQIELKIAAGTYKIVKNTSGKAEYFRQSKIGLVAAASDDDVTVVKGFAACFRCKTVLTWDSSSTGNSRLNRHAIDCYSSHSHSKSQEPASESQLSRFLTKAPSKKQADRLLEVCCGFISIDLQPFKAVEGQGKHSLFLNSLIDNFLACRILEVGSDVGRTWSRLWKY